MKKYVFNKKENRVNGFLDTLEYFEVKNDSEEYASVISKIENILFKFDKTDDVRYFFQFIIDVEEENTIINSNNWSFYTKDEDLIMTKNG